MKLNYCDLSCVKSGLLKGRSIGVSERETATIIKYFKWGSIEHSLLEAKE